MQNTDSGNQFNFCGMVTGGEKEGQDYFRSHSSIKKAKYFPRGIRNENILWGEIEMGRGEGRNQRSREGGGKPSLSQPGVWGLELFH